MDAYGVPLTLSCGATVTVRAWGYEDYTACLLDLRHLLAALQMGPGEVSQLLLERVLEFALPREGDRLLVVAADLPELLSAIFELNRVAPTSGRAVQMAADNGESGLNLMKPRWTLDDLRLAMGTEQLRRTPPAAFKELYATLSRQEAARRFFALVENDNYGVSQKWKGKGQEPSSDWEYDSALRQQTVQQLGEEAGLLPPDDKPKETPFERLARQRRERRRK